MSRSIVYVLSMSKPKMSYRDLSNKVRSIMKTQHDNDMIDRTSTIYAKNKTKFPCSIGLGAVYDEN